MIQPRDYRPAADFLYRYQQIVSAKYASKVNSWPLLNGWDILQGTYRNWQICVIKDTPFSVTTRMNSLGELSSDILEGQDINSSNREQARKILETYFNISERDVVVFYPPESDFEPEFAYMLRRHERAQGLSPMKIFLSHKGADKPKVREFKSILLVLGFTPWLDEDSMHAGTELERGILEGFKESCAAVFFITKNFKDENYIASEVNYAIAEKRKKKEKFSIITIVFDADVSRKNVPDLLHQYVWKEPASDLEALKEVILALPIKVGDVYWK